jgi:DNA-directed RNA polymerase specialized sigma24 family protein
MKREKLFLSILEVLNRWPELERSIFSQAHYGRQSVNAIASSHQLDVEEVNTILRRCNSRLCASLKGYRKSDGERPPFAEQETDCPAACKEDLNGTHGPALKLKSIRDILQAAV